MKKFLIKLMVFAIFSVGFYLVVMPIWSSLFPPFMAKNTRNCMGCYGHFFSRTQDAQTVKNPDILFLGSSHSYRGFDTRVFEKAGYNTFNLGSSSQSPVNTHAILKQYLAQINPKLVVYEVYAGTLGVNGNESALDILSNGKMDRHAVQMALELNNLNTYNTLIFSGFRNFFGMNNHFREAAVQDRDHYVKGGGYVESQFQKNPLKEEQSKPWSIHPMQWEKLEENIAILKAHRIPYVLVHTPITKKLYNARTNNDEIDRKLEKLGPYKNFYGAIPLNDTIDFYDSNHMNQQAVEKFNTLLIHELQNRELIPTK